MQVAVLSSSAKSRADVVPSLDFLAHRVSVMSADVSAAQASKSDIMIIDARTDLAAARTLSRTLAIAMPEVPRLAALTEGGLVAVAADWQLTDVLITSVTPAELDMRLRLAKSWIGVESESSDIDDSEAGPIVVDEHNYSAKVRGRSLDLTFKEFELLKYLVAYPDRAFTRSQLLQEVWGYDYFGGTRTVDVHIRRLRAKLGPDFEHLIGTIRNVGYRYNAEADEDDEN